MNLQLLTDNLTNPALLLFILGLVAVIVKSDLAIPDNSSRFISIYLLFAIGFKGGQELAHSHFTIDMLWVTLLCISSGVAITYYTYAFCKRKFSKPNAIAVAASYGSVSAITFVTALSFLEVQGIPYHGYMIAMLALMEVPAIIIAVLLLSKVTPNSETSLSSMIKHSFTNASVFLIIGSMLVGFLANDQQALDIKPFTNDIFKGFLAIFLLDKGIDSGRNLKEFFKEGYYAIGFAIFIPIFNGCLFGMISNLMLDDVTDRFLVSVLSASASYIAVPAAMKLANPEANPGLFIPMALAVTFPINIIFGLPLYMYIVGG